MYKFGNRIDIELKCVLYRVNIENKHEKRFRSHDSIVYYIKGGHEFYFENKKIAASDGDIMYIPYGASYKNRSLSRDTEYYQIEFHVYEDGIPVPLFEVPKILSTGDNVRLFPLFHEAYIHYIEKTYGSDQLCIGNLLGIIGRIANAEEKKRNITCADRIAATLTYIEEFYNLNTTAEELAGISATSVSNMEKIFKSCFGMSPLAYRNSIRIDRAKDYLAGGKTIDDTAREIGFSDRYYFSKIFKKFTGMSPGEFIKSCEI